MNSWQWILVGGMPCWYSFQRSFHYKSNEMIFIAISLRLTKRVWGWKLTISSNRSKFQSNFAKFKKIRRVLKFCICVQGPKRHLNLDEQLDLMKKWKSETPYSPVHLGPQRRNLGYPRPTWNVICRVQFGPHIDKLGPPGPCWVHKDWNWMP